MRLTDEWAPGCWSAAVLKVSEQHIVWSDPEESEGVRYPEQWMFVLWRPFDEPRPFRRPDAWGMTIGHPKDEVAKMVDNLSTVYILPDKECLWSSWLTIPLICDRFEPWLISAIQMAIQTQQAAERGRYALWYGNERTVFDQFLQRVTQSPPPTA